MFTDEAYVFSGIVKRKGWHDTRIPRFASQSMFKKYSYRLIAGKEKGTRAIVIAALCESGVVPNCTKVFVSGARSFDADYYKEDVGVEVAENATKEDLMIG
ncbi:hypothetical protein OESDEN_09720 [Oesophagostomum dentatum]|uniref:Uncharacterized protein n=1 Tax=Oesophagostomum dentatum TaxID=61180 RepID=A0A0B1SYQ0_OESDE|nr:hypothetical protein OESDEN_09720 [Oesophagostomum dentatum]